jgi:hypothetical protein
MKTLFFTIVMAFCAATSAAETPVFYESRIVKRMTVTQWVGEKVSPETGFMYFEGLVLDDASLWIRPVLKGKEAVAKVGPISLSRTVPVNVPLAGYKAHEFFAFDNQVYVTVSDSIDPEHRYIMALKPHMQTPTNLGRMVWAAIPIRNLIIISYLNVMLLEAYPKTCLALTWLFSALGVSQCLTDITNEIERNRVSVLPHEPVARESGDRLRVARYVYDSNWKIKDVLLRARDGKNYSLRELTGYRKCAAELEPALASNR